MSTDKAQQVKLTTGRWCWWEIEQPMPAKLKVYEGAWEHKRHVGWCTRQHAAPVKHRGVYHSVNHRGHQIDIRIAGDVDAFYGDEEG